MIAGKDSGSSKPWYDASLGVRELRWLLPVALVVLALSVTLAISLNGAGGSKKVAVTTHKHRASLRSAIEKFLHASSIQQLQCARSSTGPAGRRSCQVEFTNTYGTWWATLVVAQHYVVRDPGGNANWLCASACTPLPTTTGLPRKAPDSGSGKTVDEQNSGVVSGTGNTGSAFGTGNTGIVYGSGSTGAYGTGSTGSVYGTGNTGIVYGSGSTGVYGTGNTGIVYGSGDTGVVYGSGNSGGSYTGTPGGGYTGTTPGG